jgi:hypothetical protein
VSALRNIDYFRIFPFWWTKDICDKKGKTLEYHRVLWPFFTVQGRDENYSLKILDFFPERIISGVDRNWSPLWTFFDYRRSSKGYSYDLLWGIFSGYGEASGKKQRFSISGIYDSRFDGNEARRDFFCGALSIVSKRAEDMSFKLLWLLEF